MCGDPANPEKAREYDRKDPTRDNCFTCRAGDTHPVMADEGPPSTSC